MTHKVVAIKCNFARGKLVLQAIGESPRGTKVLLAKTVMPHFDPGNSDSRRAAKEAVRHLMHPLDD